MFWNLFSSSISLATVTPSLVTVGAPHDFLDHDVAAARSQGDLDGVGEQVEALGDLVASARREDDFFGSHCAVLDEAMKRSAARTAREQRRRGRGET